MSHQILKVQRPIATNDPNREWLFYNQDRSVLYQRIPTPDEIKAMADDYKMYAQYTHEKFSKRVVGPAF